MVKGKNKNSATTNHRKFGHVLIEAGILFSFASALR